MEKEITYKSVTCVEMKNFIRTCLRYWDNDKLCIPNHDLNKQGLYDTIFPRYTSNFISWKKLVDKGDYDTLDTLLEKKLDQLLASKAKK